MRAGSETFHGSTAYWEQSWQGIDNVKFLDTGWPRRGSIRIHCCNPRRMASREELNVSRIYSDFTLFRHREIGAAISQGIDRPPASFSCRSTVPCRRGDLIRRHSPQSAASGARTDCSCNHGVEYDSFKRQALWVPNTHHL